MQTSGTQQALSARQNAAVRARTRPNEIGQVTGRARGGSCQPGAKRGADSSAPVRRTRQAASQRPGERPHRGGPWLAASGDEGQPAGPDGGRGAPRGGTAESGDGAAQPGRHAGRKTMMHTSPPSATAVIWVSNDVTGVCLRSIITSPAAATASARGPSAGEGRQHPAMPRTPGVSRLVPRVLQALPWAGPGQVSDDARERVRGPGLLGCLTARRKLAGGPSWQAAEILGMTCPRCHLAGPPCSPERTRRGLA